MKFTEELERVYAEWERQVIAEGIKEGMEEGSRQGRRIGFVDIYQARFGSLPGELRDALDRVQDIEVLRRLLLICGTRTQEEVNDLVRQRAAWPEPWCATAQARGPEV
jgi:DNA invertase Pin-like site-specific DNA recombinase